MDERTMKVIQEIGIKASRDAMKRGMKVERPYANMIEDMRHVAKIATTNEERREAEKMAHEMETNPLLQETIKKEELVIDEDYNREVERRTEKMMQDAIRSGKIKPPGKDYDDFMKRVHKK